MGCGASAQVSAEDGVEVEEAAEGEANEGEVGDGEGAEANGHNEDLELSDMDRTSHLGGHPDAPGRILDKAPLPPIRKTGHGDTGSILSQDSHESSFSYQNRPMTGVYRSPRKLPKLVGGRTPNVADFGAINDHNPVSDVKLEGALIEQDEDDDNPFTEDKGTNTIDVMNESFETVELTEGGDLHGVGEPEEEVPDDTVPVEEPQEEETVHEDNADVEDGEKIEENLSEEKAAEIEEELEAQMAETKQMEEDAEEVEVPNNTEEEAEVPNNEEEYGVEVPDNDGEEVTEEPEVPPEGEEVEQEQEVPSEDAEVEQQEPEVPNEGEDVEEVPEVPNEDEVVEQEPEVPNEDEVVEQEPEVPNEDEVVEQEPEVPNEDPEVENPEEGEEVNAEAVEMTADEAVGENPETEEVQADEEDPADPVDPVDEDDDDDNDVVHTPAPSRPTSSTSRRTHAESDSRSASRLSVSRHNEAGSRPNSAASLSKLSTTSRRGSSASGGTRGDVEDEGDADGTGSTKLEKRRVSSRKKLVSAHRVRIAEGHELMETPSPIPNDSGADLAGDEEGDANHDPLSREYHQDGDESGLDNQESDFDQDIPITNLTGYSRSSSSVHVTG